MESVSNRLGFLLAQEREIYFLVELQKNNKKIICEILVITIEVYSKMSKRRSNQPVDSRDHEDDPPMSRLFVVCNKNISEKIIRESFSKFGKKNHFESMF